MSRAVSRDVARVGILGLAATMTLALPAAAQRLWSVEEVATRSLPPIEVGGVARVPTAASGVPLTAEVATVQVELDYLRLGMGYLELPLFDGSVIEAENAVFEDRGNGNLMWTGEVPGAGYESVLFTVQEGHLVGWFGEPGGPKYVVYAGPDGRGTLAVEVGPTGDWCGVESRPGSDLAAAGVPAVDRPAPVASRSSDDRLDILVLYSSGTEQYWRTIGGPAAGVQQLADYLNLVLRNGAIAASAHLIPVRWDPELAGHPRMQGFHFRKEKEAAGSLWHWEFHLRGSAEVATIRSRYRPDLVHFIPDVGTRLAGGAANQRGSLDPLVLSGWSTPSPAGIFAHEIGHNLGGHHVPSSWGSGFREFQAGAFRPYMFGHRDLTSCARREGYGNLLACPQTVMSSGSSRPRDDGSGWLVTEPFYSSVRHKPNGWTIGVAGTSEVERVLHETVPVAVRIGMDVAYTPEQRPRTMTARWTGRDTVRVTWSEDGRSRDTGGTLWLALTEGPSDRYEWRWDWRSVPPTLREGTSGNLVPLVEADGTQIGVDVGGLRPGGRYRMSVSGGGHTLEGGEWRRRDVLSSDVFELAPPGRPPGSPEAPGNVGASVTGPGSVRLNWRDNSRTETGYEVWWRKWSGSESDEVWRRYGPKLRAGASSVEIGGLMAEEEIEVTTGFRRWDRAIEDYVSVESETTHVGRYSFVVVAYNERGFSASETLNHEFAPGPFPAPTRNGVTPVCRRRATGLAFDGYEVEMCVETPDGERRRVWDYELDADQSGLLHFFDRDNVEVLVKVLDGCGINGYRWVFVAPVTNLAFRLAVRQLAPPQASARQIWHYDSERRPQEELWSTGTPRSWRRGESQHYVGNAQGRTARTVSDTTAFPCTAAEIAAARAKAADGGVAPLGSSEMPALVQASLGRLSAGAETGCEPGEAVLTLGGGYAVGMCFETRDGQIGDARDWGLDSSQSGLLYFFDRNNAEVLIKVLDACGVNGHRWVFVAPVTDLAFNLVVRSPDGEVWTHTNRLGQTAEAKSDVSAFPCAS